MARWCYRTGSLILLLHTDSAVKPLSLALLGYWRYRKLIDETRCGRQLVYTQSMLATSISSSLRSYKGIILSVPRVKTNSGAEAFRSCTQALWNNLPLLLHSVSSIANFWKHLRIHLLDFAFPHNHQHAQWLADVTDCFMNFAVRHRLQYRATEPGLAGVIGALKLNRSTDMPCFT